MSLDEDWNISIESYALLKHLGGGGYGTVFLARYFPDDSLRVVKVLHRLGYDPEKRFEREIRILQERSNLNTVEILDFGNTYAGHKYYAMEYCPLGDIRKFIGVVNITFALMVLDDIGRALTPFHERGGFHRDIKPDNILMAESDGKLIFKLSDFGLAQDNNTSSVFTNNAAGTLGYLAPEIISGGYCTAASDVYSLGITIRELLNGNLQNTSMTREKFGDLAMILARMLLQSPEKRFDLSRLHKLVAKRLYPTSNEQITFVAPIAVPKQRLAPEF